MASAFAHPFVALSLTPWFRRAGLTTGVAWLGALCTVAPDFDVLGYYLGVPYEHLMGHRGFTHSIVFAALLAAALTALLRRYRSTTGAAVFVFLFLCTLSHGLLDALTSGGLGIAFLSPFSNERFFFPWHPIRVSPLSVSGFLTARGWVVLSSELIWVMLPSLVVYGVGRLAAPRAAPGPSAEG
jgi:inner membrane protein